MISAKCWHHEQAARDKKEQHMELNSEGGLAVRL